MPAQLHRSDPRILGRRTLHQDHRRLAELLRPGLSVLDVGCGTGAITAGIAEAVGPRGRVVGMDRDEQLLEIARREHGKLTNLHFEHGDVKALCVDAEFDIVTAARTLQWIAEPAVAIAKMKQAAKPSGLIVVLDYNHAGNHWEPDPPSEFQRFYSAFLAWRQANGWDNQMAEHLPGLMRSQGLIEIESQVQDEIAERGESDFAERAALWSEVIENVGPQLIAGGFSTASELKTAYDCYRLWVHAELRTQLLAMCTVTGTVPHSAVERDSSRTPAARCGAADPLD